MLNRQFWPGIVVLSCFWCLGASAACDQELYVKPDTTKVQWTAFKTTQKTPVSGEFASITLLGDLKGKDLVELLSKTKAEIQFTKVDQSRTGNPARDQTLFDKFFSLWKGKGIIQGKILKAQKEQFDLQLTLNNKTVKVPMKYRVDAGDLIAEGSFDLLAFGLTSAFDSLHKACEALHTGTDGVSKTWTQVDLKITSKIGMTCL